MEVRKTDEFVEWFDALRDRAAKARIQVRIDRMERGNLGDAKFFDGIGELRIDYGSGYRVYFIKRDNVIVILLCGGDKSSQQKDIRKAQLMAKSVKPPTPNPRTPIQITRFIHMTIRTTKWDTSEFLDSEEAIVAYIEAAFEDGDPAAITHALGNVARARGMTAIAKEAGVTRRALYKALSEDGDPRLSTLLGVVKALGVRLSVTAGDDSLAENRLAS